MTGEEKEPRSVMSRNKGHGAVVTGGRSIRHKIWAPTAHRKTWPTNPDKDLEPALTEKSSSKRQRIRRGIRAETGRAEQAEASTRKSGPMG